MSQYHLNVDRVVLDTSFFINPQIEEKTLSTEKAIEIFVNFAKKEERHIVFYIPLSVLKELSKYVSEDYTLLLEASTICRAPRKLGLVIPVQVLYDYIEDMRNRVNKGLRVAEEAARSLEPEDVKIRKLRERYREALREGTIDSVEDLDVLFLAYEVDGLLVSNDKGLLRWAEKLGIRSMCSEKFWRLILQNTPKY
ncbi:MAG: RNA ligase partner protein [Thermoprotei archaeon]|nr:MAG: RNA ligase partner protein [Thermoprotei archaeon]